LAAARALEQADMALLGQLMAQSHASMRDDFSITTPELDFLADLMGGELAGAGGARMTGGGFGGAAIAIANRARIEALAAKVAATYRTPEGGPPQIMLETATAGARIVED
jgi:galactokinase